MIDIHPPEVSRFFYSFDLDHCSFWDWPSLITNPSSYNKNTFFQFSWKLNVVRRVQCPVLFQILQFSFWTDQSLVKINSQHCQCNPVIRFEFPFQRPQSISRDKYLNSDQNLSNQICLLDYHLSRCSAVCTFWFFWAVSLDWASYFGFIFTFLESNFVENDRILWIE